ncbi:MAG: hypothetical protein M3P30_01360 [Chloroflexota bacterium]|nr:hypothetical protein [Chloroflexota bacterium]
MQGIGTDTFPEFISGFYRVDRWAPHADVQYLEFLVSVQGADFDQEGQSRELRFSIGALDQPLIEPDVSYVFVSRAPPVLHKWTYFSYPVRQAFESRFEKVPTHWQGISIGVGARLDGRQPNNAPASADVLFDDIYAGPQADNPNRPPGED